MHSLLNSAQFTVRCTVKCTVPGVLYSAQFTSQCTEALHCLALARGTDGGDYRAVKAGGAAGAEMCPRILVLIYIHSQAI